MNAKFFDLKQEKQDRMINAALKIFALNGYQHASTDDIVKEAQISKGLLFHYFDSKIGVYSFVYDYCAKYLILELSSAIDPSETSYFEIMKQMEAAKMQALKSYPYMCSFLNSCEKENVPEAVLEIEASKTSYDDSLDAVYSKSDLSDLVKTKNGTEYLSMLKYTLNSIMEDSLRDNAFNAEIYYNESIKYIDLVKKLFK